MKSFFEKIMAKLGGLFGSREKQKDELEELEQKYEEKLAAAVEKEHKNFTPASEKELVEVIRRTPREVLDIKDRNLISGAMSFKTRRAALVMMPREDITFLKDKDTLGPVILDKLYKTGETIFPVLNNYDKVCGLIRTDKLDLLHIGKNEPVAKLMEHNVAFARADYTLEQLLAVFLRNNTDYVLIIDGKEQLLGYAELDTLIAVLFNRELKDDFSDDTSSSLVAKRDLGL